MPQFVESPVGTTDLDAAGSVVPTGLPSQIIGAFPALEMLGYYHNVPPGRQTAAVFCWPETFGGGRMKLG
jgi:hypothetical protein